MRLEAATVGLLAVCLAAGAAGCLDQGLERSGVSDVGAADGGPGDVDDAGDDVDRGDGGVDAGPSCEQCPACVACEFRGNAERSCSSADGPPARCEADPTTYDDWGPGAVLTGLEVTSDRARECCFNLDGSEDGSVDNEVGELVSGLPFDLDRMIKRGLVYEEYVGVAEFDGLSDLEQSEPFTVQGYLGYFGSPDASQYVEKADEACALDETDCQLEARSGERYWLNPESLEEGARSQVQFEPAGVSGATLEAGPGDISLEMVVRNLGRVALEVRGVRVEADMDVEATDLGSEGVVVEEGRVGGYILLEDIVGLLNSLMSSCVCLDSPDRAIEVPNTDPEDPDPFPEACEQGEAPEEECQFSCADQILEEASTCSRRAPRVCREAERICSLLNLLPGLADLDADGDGQLDALSVGAVFEMTGARIAGVADYIRASDQRPGEQGGLAVEQVYVREPGWVALYTSRSLEAETLVGHAELDAGGSSEVTIPTDGLESGQRVWAVLYRDDGPETGVFEPEDDTKVRRYPEASGVVSESLWVRRR